MLFCILLLTVLVLILVLCFVIQEEFPYGIFVMFFLYLFPCWKVIFYSFQVTVNDSWVPSNVMEICFQMGFFAPLL